MEKKLRRPFIHRIRLTRRKSSKYKFNLLRAGLNVKTGFFISELAKISDSFFILLI